ncbi:MAG: PDZ domain-containing protein [Planctomycetes bacterium]|nr:PDZ domain-containing protein [Planctomycetota bacterium]
MSAAPCADYVSLIPGAALGVLEPDEESRVTDHLQGCTPCQAFSKTVHDTLEAAAPKGELPPHGAYERLERLLEPQAASPKLRVTLNCTYCHDALGRAEASFCASCLAPHHPECFSEHGRCAGPGCDETQSVAPRDVPAPTRRRRRGVGWLLPAVGILCGGVTAAAVGWLSAEPRVARERPEPRHDGRTAADWLRVASILTDRDQSNPSWNEALGALVALGADGEFELSHAIMDSHDPQVRETALQLAGELRAEGCLDALLELGWGADPLGDPALTAVARVLAAQPADSDERRRVVAELAQILERHPARSRRETAISVLVELGGPIAEAALVQALRDPAPLIPELALDALSRRPPQSVAGFQAVVAYDRARLDRPDDGFGKLPQRVGAALWGSAALGQQLPLLEEFLGAAPLKSDRLAWLLSPLGNELPQQPLTTQTAVARLLTRLYEAAPQGSPRRESFRNAFETVAQTIAKEGSWSGEAFAAIAAGPPSDLFFYGLRPSRWPASEALIRFLEGEGALRTRLQALALLASDARSFDPGVAAALQRAASSSTPELAAAARTALGPAKVETPTPASSKGFLGLSLADDDGSGALRVGKVVPEGPAQLAGLEPGMQLLELDGQPLQTATQFVLAVTAKEPGQVLTLLVQVPGEAEPRTVTVTLETRPR